MLFCIEKTTFQKLPGDLVCYLQMITNRFVIRVTVGCHKTDIHIRRKKSFSCNSGLLKI